ncbi:hypothetical protein U1Q18_035804 [Sarracenia purpurea var. burkii]
MSKSTAHIHVLGGTSFNMPKLKKSSCRSDSVGAVRVVADKVAGIDLGTTNSTVAAMERGKPVIITNSEGQHTTSSVVAYTKVGDLLVGQIAAANDYQISTRWRPDRTPYLLSSGSSAIGARSTAKALVHRRYVVRRRRRRGDAASERWCGGKRKGGALVWRCSPEREGHRDGAGE